MPDNADIANEKTEAELERHIAAARGIETPRETAECCAECGCEIPSARQIAMPGCQYCLECQLELEARAARRV